MFQLKFVLPIFLALLVVIIFAACRSNRYVEFKIVTDDSENNYFEKQINDSDFFNNVQTVLRVYNIDFKIKNETILIPKSVYNDKELCKNISTKASDPDWIESNK